MDQSCYFAILVACWGSSVPSSQPVSKKLALKHSLALILVIFSRNSLRDEYRCSSDFCSCFQNDNFYEQTHKRCQTCSLGSTCKLFVDGNTCSSFFRSLGRIYIQSDYTRFFTYYKPQSKDLPCYSTILNNLNCSSLFEDDFRLLFVSLEIFATEVKCCFYSRDFIFYLSRHIFQLYFGSLLFMFVIIVV